IAAVCPLAWTVPVRVQRSGCSAATSWDFGTRYPSLRSGEWESPGGQWQATFAGLRLHSFCAVLCALSVRISGGGCGNCMMRFIGIKFAYALATAILTLVV